MIVQGISQTKQTVTTLVNQIIQSIMTSFMNATETVTIFSINK